MKKRKKMLIGFGTIGLAFLIYGLLERREEKREARKRKREMEKEKQERLQQNPKTAKLLEELRKEKNQFFNS